MQTSERFGFVLPSRDAPDDIADINQISDNFRIIDNKMVEREEGKGLSENDYTTQEKNKLKKLSENNISATANDGDKEYYSVFDAQPTNAYIYSHEVGDTLNATEFRVEKDKISLVGIVDGQENNPVAMHGIKTPDGTDPTQAVNVAYINNLPQNLSNVAPAILNSKGGTAVALTDVSPFEHTLKIKATSDTVDVSTAKVQRYGKSLFDFEYKFMQTNIHRIDSKNMLIPIQNQVFAFSIDKAPMEFGLHIEYADGSVKSLTIGYNAVKYFFKFDGEVLRFGISSSCGVTKNLDGKVKRFGFWVYGQNRDGWDTEPLCQVELNIEPTEYEPYTEPTTHDINADGTVEGVTSLYPTTTLISDTEGVVLDVEYNADTKKFILNEIAKIQALVLEN